MKEENKTGYGPGKDITNTLLTQGSYSEVNKEKIKSIISKMELTKDKDTYQYAKKIVNGKIGRIPVDELPEHFNRNQASEKTFNNIEMYNSMSKHNSFKLSQHMNKK